MLRRKPWCLAFNGFGLREVDWIERTESPFSALHFRETVWVVKTQTVRKSLDFWWPKEL